VSVGARCRPIGLIKNRASDALSGGTIRSDRGRVRRRGGAGGVRAAADAACSGVSDAERGVGRRGQRSAERSPSTKAERRYQPVPSGAVSFSRHAPP